MTRIANGLVRLGHDLSRRQVILGAGGIALAGSSRAWAAAEPQNTLKVGFVSPRTGPLAGFGKTDGYVLELARKALAKGLAVGGKTYQVEILDRDTQSDASRASQLAKELINTADVDLMLATSTPETINPVASWLARDASDCVSRSRIST